MNLDTLLPRALPVFTFNPPSFTSSSKDQSSSTDNRRPRRSIIRLREEVWGSLASTSNRSRDEEEEEQIENVMLEPHPQKERTTIEGEQRRKRKHTAVDNRKAQSVKKLEQVEESEIFASPAQASTSRLRSRATRVDSSSSSNKGEKRSSRRKSAPTRRKSRSPPAPRAKESDSRRRNEPLRQAERFPSLYLPTMQKTLESADYDPYLLPNSSIEPSHSYDFHHLQLEFFCSIAAPRLWSRKPASSVFNRPTFSGLNFRLLNTKLNLDEIRKDFPLEKVDPEMIPDSQIHAIWTALMEVLKWLYGRGIEREEMYWFVENAPLPLLVLTRLHVDTVRYSFAVNFAKVDFRNYLERSKLSQLSPEEARARLLLGWLRPLSMWKKTSKRWDDWWIEEVVRRNEGRKSITTMWMRGEEGWEDEEALERWERGNILEKK